MGQSLPDLATEAVVIFDDASEDFTEQYRAWVDDIFSQDPDLDIL